MHQFTGHFWSQYNNPKNGWSDEDTMDKFGQWCELCDACKGENDVSKIETDFEALGLPKMAEPKQAVGDAITGMPKSEQPMKRPPPNKGITNVTNAREAKPLLKQNSFDTEDSHHPDPQVLGAPQNTPRTKALQQVAADTKQQGQKAKPKAAAQMARDTQPTDDDAQAMGMAPVEAEAPTASELKRQQVLL
jgi:hypothetical protein